jgi:serine/threonine-protein kinase
MPTGAIEISRIRAALADRYRIEHVLGEGGMATVYQAEDLKHRRKVAVKVMRPELAETLGAERFLREVEIAARLSHPHILPVHDSGATNGILYYVMPMVEGESLPARLAREKQLPVAEALRLAREVAEALAYAHERGFVHRDIKPANILISAGHALVADFGIARAMTGDGRALTQTGLAIGTPQYMSPEQASGSADLDGRSDIYALGCVLYEMIAGEPPFTGPTAQAIISRSITETPRALTSTRDSLPPAVDAAVMKALAKTPADRYGTAAEMTAALAAAEDQSRSGATAVSAASGGGFKTWQLALMGAAVLAVGALGTKLLSRETAAEEGATKVVAVLPFENQGTADDAYFADGVVDEVRDKLATLSQLTVIASASADQYRETTKTVPQIASELHADQVLMGKVRWIDGPGGERQVRVVTELVDGTDGSVTWRDSFDATRAGILELQGRIATRVAVALGVTAPSADATDLASQRTSSPEAYELFLKARGIRSNSAADARVAAGYLEQAVALDSNFAYAWGGLAARLSELYFNGTRDQAVARRAREALDRMMTFAGDSVAGAYVVVANYHNMVDRDQAAARRAIDRALELDPNDAGILATSANYDFREERFDAALEKLSRARELDPLSGGVLNTLVDVLINLGRVEEAKAAGEELLALEPSGTNPMQTVVNAFVASNDIKGAQRAIRDFLTRVPATELVSYFAGYNEMAYLFESKERELLFRLPPAAFDNDVAWWGQSLATAAYQQGDMARARAYADSSLATSREQSEANPDDPQLRVLYAVMLAYLGRAEEAVAQADTALGRAQPGNNSESPYVREQAIRVYLALGQTDRAMDAVEALAAEQYHLNPGYLQANPLFKPLKGNPRFERLLAGKMNRPVD